MYGKETKSVNKSFRMTPTVLQFIEKFEGDGLNEKLNSLVMDYYTRETEIEKAIEKKQEQLKQAEKQYKRMCAKVWDMKDLNDALQNITIAANKLKDKINVETRKI